MPVDYHIHTKLCGHACGEMEEYVARAKQKNLKEIGFSDHIPLYFFPPVERDPSVAMNAEELPLYTQKVLDLQKKFYPYPIKMGIEADYVPGMEASLSAILGRYDFDYVLGSIHFLNGWGFDNPQYKAEYAKWDIYALYELYFSVLGQAATCGLFDVLAHPDLVKKFAFDPVKDLTPLYEKAIREIAASGVSIEVNTAGLRVPAKEIYPNRQFLSMCYEHGITVTLGSDAHQPEYVGADFEQAVKLLKSVGYREVVTFSSRSKNYCPI